MAVLAGFQESCVGLLSELEQRAIFGDQPITKKAFEDPVETIRIITVERFELALGTGRVT